MISRPCRSSARARASTSKADSVPSRLIDGANLMSAFSSCDVVAGIIRDGRHHRRSLTPGAIADISTAMKRLVFVAALVLVTGTAEARSEEHTSELQSQSNIVCRLLLEKKKILIDIVA